MSVIEGKFGKEEKEKPTAVQCLEEFLEQITRPAVEDGTHSTVDAVVVQLDDFGVSVGSNADEAAHVVMLLELAKLSIMEQFLGQETEGGPNGTVH
jgi:hypothetical protein